MKRIIENGNVVMKRLIFTEYAGIVGELLNEMMTL